ncbi:hypothetical protein FO519_004567 [Halicephalobus sp. NKZ332]|nr:hypothetical protein FO519_004567 [Halicephalobus sp. NKZ332]
MPKPTTPAEWQLQAVLFHAKLTQYYEKFISLGGDDVDQMMQSDEQEFLEIMKLIGMASKPLHGSVTHIGPPPVDFPSSSTTTPVQAALQFLIPGFASSTPGPSTSIESLMSIQKLISPGLYQTSPSSSGIPITSTSSASATANIFPLSTVDQTLLNLVGQVPMQSLTPPGIPQISGASGSRTHSPAIAGPSGEPRTPFVASPGSESELSSDQPFEGGILPETDIPIIQKLAKQLYEQQGNLHQLEPRYVQNKKKLPKELLDVMSLPCSDPNRIIEYRKFSAIYGRYDAKRKPDKPLSYHELLVNEAAAQLCLLQPVLLTRRDELFPLARKVVRATNFSGFRTISQMENRKRQRSQSPSSNPSNRSSPETTVPEKLRSVSSAPESIASERFKTISAASESTVVGKLKGASSTSESTVTEKSKNTPSTSESTVIGKLKSAPSVPESKREKSDQ